jgi:hypothetical protein
VKIGVTASQISAEGKLILGLNPDTALPAWISFPDVPHFSFKIGVTNLSVPVEKLVKEFVKIAIKQHLLYPKRFFLEQNVNQTEARKNDNNNSSNNNPSTKRDPTSTTGPFSKQNQPSTSPLPKSKK